MTPKTVHNIDFRNYFFTIRHECKKFKKRIKKYPSPSISTTFGWVDNDWMHCSLNTWQAGNPFQVIQKITVFNIKQLSVGKVLSFFISFEYRIHSSKCKFKYAFFGSFIELTAILDREALTELHLSFRRSMMMKPMLAASRLGTAGTKNAPIKH